MALTLGPAGDSLRGSVWSIPGESLKRYKRIPRLPGQPLRYYDLDDPSSRANPVTEYRVRKYRRELKARSPLEYEVLMQDVRSSTHSDTKHRYTLARAYQAKMASEGKQMNLNQVVRDPRFEQLFQRVNYYHYRGLDLTIDRATIMTEYHEVLVDIGARRPTDDHRPETSEKGYIDRVMIPYFATFQ